MTEPSRRHLTGRRRSSPRRPEGGLRVLGRPSRRRTLEGFHLSCSASDATVTPRCCGGVQTPRSAWRGLLRRIAGSGGAPAVPGPGGCRRGGRCSPKRCPAPSRGRAGLRTSTPHRSLSLTSLAKARHSGSPSRPLPAGLGTRQRLLGLPFEPSFPEAVPPCTT